MQTGKVILTLIVTLGLWPSPAFPQEPRTINKAEIYVSDGDTIRTTTYGRIRLRTCDAPEFDWPSRQAAVRATERLMAMIDKAKRIEVVCIWEPPCRDFFGRQLCDLVLDGNDACDTLIAEGLADKQKRMRPCSRDWARK